MRAFIVRPFSVKQGIDFDRVERELIRPALERLKITGGTTGEIVKQGNIRTDMFQQLLIADLVVADLSIHNANVFYELGIRHAFRDKRTVLIRSRGDDVPFDLKTDRYLSYDKDDPAASVDLLERALRDSVNSSDRDSPVFQLLPELEEQDPARFQIVPRGFREEVDLAREKKLVGDLQMLFDDATGFDWETQGFRLVGRAQRVLKRFEEARTTWEAVRRIDEGDAEANTQLGTIYQRLNELTLSDQAVRRVLEHKSLDAAERAEAYALLGSNEKTRWKAQWQDVPETGRREEALRSPFLMRSYEAYAEGFRQELNHYYSGLNALAMLTVLTELAQSLPEVWSEDFDSDEEADRGLGTLCTKRDQLIAALELSMQAAKDKSEKQGQKDIWLDISLADLSCLTSKNLRRVARAYERALADAGDFNVDSIQRQLALYERLEVKTDNVKAALEVVNKAAEKSKKEDGEKYARVLVFTGHRVDAPGRTPPRFPNEKQEEAKKEIRDAVSKEKELAQGPILGIAGGANGGDILFHEVCKELGIETEMYLAIPKEEYIVASVQAEDPSWVERFNRLHESLPMRVLCPSGELPPWLQGKPNYSVWQRNNLWVLHNALARGPSKVTLIALWDSGKGDGPGGTEDMVSKVKQRGAKTVVLDTKKIFSLS